MEGLAAAGLALHGALDSSMSPCPNPGSLLAECTIAASRSARVERAEDIGAHGTCAFPASARDGARAPVKSLEVELPLDAIRPSTWFSQAGPT